MTTKKKSSNKNKFVRGGMSPLKGGEQGYPQYIPSAPPPEFQNNQYAPPGGPPPQQYPQQYAPPGGPPPQQYSPQPQEYSPQPQIYQQQLQQQVQQLQSPYSNQQVSFFPFLGLNRIPWLICIVLILIPSLLYQLLQSVLEGLNPYVLKGLSAFVFIYYVLFVPLIAHYGLYIFGFYGIVLMNY